MGEMTKYPLIECVLAARYPDNRLFGLAAMECRQLATELRALLADRDAAVGERDKWVLRAHERNDEVRTLRARLAACEGGLNYIRRVTVGAVESDKLAATCKTIGEYRAVLLKAIDALSLDDDFGPNDGHARAVTPTPPQDAATTRGE
jgi:hypothetical protein